MIYQNSIVTVNRGEAKIDTPIVLYRGDKEVEINFTILNSPFKYRTGNATNLIESTEADYAQLIIKVPNDRSPIFSEITETQSGNVVFTITAEMIDELEELGLYDFQIRLFDSEKTSRATIPPVTGGIEIREPIAIEDGTTSTSNEVNVATANYAVTTTATSLDVFDEDGNYIETTWSDKMLITDARLNKIEQGITGVNQKADSVTGASNITIADTANNFTATNVEGALQEVSSQIKDIANELGRNEDDTEIDMGTTATTIRGAIKELRDNQNSGGSGTGTSTVNKLSGVKIGVLGDSVSAGNYYCYGDENANVKTWHEIIANHTGCTINNVSRGGSALTTVTEDGYSFIDRYNNLDSNCDVILVFGGINDYTWAGGTELGNIGDTDTNNICGALKTLCEGLINKYPSTPIGFILPYGFNEYKGSGTWKPYEDKIIEVLNYYGIPVCNLRTGSIMNANIDFINSKYFRYSSADAITGDKTHPNTTGHSIIAKPILSFIENIYYDIYSTNISSEILPTSISMRETLKITTGEESTLVVTFVPPTTTDKTINWESDNTDIATVSDGVVTGVAEGNCNITATTINGKTATCAITVGNQSTTSYITDGLTNFWNPIGQERQATSWADEAGNKVATISGLDYTDEGFIDNKLSIRGINGEKADPSSLTVPFEITDNCTFEIAMKPSSITNNTYVIGSIFEIYESPYFGLRIGFGANLENCVPISSLAELPLLSIAFIKNGDTISVVTNGVTSKTLTETIENGQVRFTSKNIDWNTCNDDIYSIKVYNRALSDAELLQNYEYYKTLV